MYPYCKEVFEILLLKNVSSAEILLKSLSKALIFHLLISTSVTAFLPAASTLIEDLPSSYPIPLLIILISISCPLLIIGVNLAKDPTPLSTRFGGELY